MSANTPAPSTNPADRVPLPQKIAYGLGTFHDMWGHWLYHTIAYPVFNIYLGVSPALVGTALLCNRLFDAVSDPFCGWWSDNTRTKYGRRRPFILCGGILAGLLLPGLFLAGRGWAGSQYFWFMVLTSAVYIPVMSSFNMAFQSLGAEMTPDYHERTLVMSYKGVIQKVAEVGMFFAAQFTTLSMFSDATGKPDILRGAQVYCTLLGGVMIVCALIMFFVLRERYYRNVTARHQEKVSLKAALWQTLSCKPFRLLLGWRLAYAMGLSMVGTLGYYMTIYFVCRGDIVVGNKWNSWMGVAGMVFAVFGVTTFATITRRAGKRDGLMSVFGTTAAVFLASWWLYDPSHPALQIFASGLIAFGQSAFWMLDGSILADIIDYDELETGKRREGTFQACANWTVKAGLALGAGAAGWVLAQTGFDAALGGAQTEQTLTTIRLVFAGIPIVGILLGSILLARYPLTKDAMAEIRAKLEARRGTV
ncbi:MAG TPA: MFS transporter [Lacunisphaera sp.]|nr:MFS transporter [Lacunisphaera sp.]